MSEVRPQYWYACIGDPHHVLHEPSGRFKSLLVESSDPSITVDQIKDAIREFVQFPAGDNLMEWKVFQSITFDGRQLPGNPFTRGAHIKVWAWDPLQP